MTQIPSLPPQIGNQMYQKGQTGMNPMNNGLILQQMMGLSGKMNNLNQNINKGTDEGEIEQNNIMMKGGLIQNNIENIFGVNGIGVGLNNS